MAVLVHVISMHATEMIEAEQAEQMYFIDRCREASLSETHSCAKHISIRSGCRL